VNLASHITTATAAVIAFFGVGFKRLKQPSHRRAVIVSVMAVLSVSTAAFAYWTGTGSGTGSGTAGTTLALTLTSGTPTAALRPGSTAGVTLTVSNPNSFSVHIGSIVLDSGWGTGGFAVDGSHSGCGLATLSMASQNGGGAGWTIAGGGSPSITLANALTMSAAAADACQGASFTVYLAAGS
jgi:hypothetical protein